MCGNSAPVTLRRQAQAVEACIAAGKTESAEFSLDESLAVMQILDTVRAQLGVVFPADRA